MRFEFAGLYDAEIRIGLVKCRYCRVDTTRVRWGNRDEFDSRAHPLCSPTPPFLPDKRPARSAEIRDLLASWMDGTGKTEASSASAIFIENTGWTWG